MRLAALYLATLILFFAGDMIGIPLFVLPLFEPALGDALLDQPRLGAALLFYLVYVCGLVGFASGPALKSGAPLLAVAARAAGLGLVSYATYEFTSLAVLRDWTWAMALTDICWGAFLSTASAALALALVRRFSRAGGRA